MEQVNVHEARSQLSRLLDRVEAGEEILIARAGRPIARLSPYKGDDASRVPGVWRGRVHIADDFDEMPEELVRAFNGEGT